MFPQLSPPSALGATYRRLYRGQCRGCGELVFHERAPGGVRIIRAGLIAVLLGVVGFFAQVGVTSRNGNNRTLSDSRRLGKRRVGVNPSLASGKAR